MKQPVERRLAAILAADVTGYSRLMGADEEGTLECLKAVRRELVDPTITKHRGRIFKTTGDGMLVEFPSVVDAVRCAVEIQQAMAVRNTGVRTDSRIDLRIGINLGDVIVDGNDLYGDGVNISARVEALADPGGVFISNTVYDQVRDRLPFVFEDLGEQQVKNITRPVRVFRVHDAARGHPESRTTPPRDRPPIVKADFSSSLAREGEATRILSGVAKLSTLAPGMLLGNTYTIEALLAHGGMGEVYRARHVELGTEHAIKIMLPNLAKDPKIVQLFREEARKLGRINNDAIVHYEGFFRDERGLRYLVTELVAGESLTEVLRRRRLEPNEVLRLRDRLALGLAAAHEMGIVHRDVSPENILLPGGSVDRAKLIDFGIAKSMDPSAATIIGKEFAGKYSYASPEQIGLFGGKVDLRSDIYSLGLVLAVAAIGFGRRLEMGFSPATMIAARQRVPDLTEVPASLRPLIASMLKPRPEDRPPSMRALLSDEDEASGAARDSTKKSPRSAKGSSVWWAGVTAAGLAASVAVVVFRQATIPPPSLEKMRTQIDAAISEYRCASLEYSVALDRSVHLSGFAATVGDIDRLRATIEHVGGVGQVVSNVELRIWPYCELVALLQPVVKRTPKPAPTITLSPPRKEAHIGDPLLVDIQAPSFDGFFYIDYFAGTEGDVLHLFPNTLDREIVKRPARNTLTLGRPPFKRCWTLSGSTGEQLITMIAATQPIFPGGRPENEKAKDYLPSLSEAINELPEGSESAAALLFFQLIDPLPSATQQNNCP
jgi:class 3 adenylate cyclase/serine/threonine protein kinase